MQSRDLTNNSDVYAANTKRLTMAQSHEAQMEKRVSRFADNRISETRDARASERCWRFSGNLGMRHIRHQSTPARKAVQSVPIQAKSIWLHFGSWKMKYPQRRVASFDPFDSTYAVILLTILRHLHDERDARLFVCDDMCKRSGDRSFASATKEMQKRTKTD